VAVLETLPLTAQQQRDRLEELLAQMKLETVRYNGAYTLSGGERRRWKSRDRSCWSPRLSSWTSRFPALTR